MPRLQAFYDNYGANGFVPVTANINEGLSVVLQYARQYTYPFLRDNGSVWNVYRQNGSIPLNYLIDADGVIRYIAEGFNETTINALIRQYLPNPIDHDVGVSRLIRPGGSADSGTTVAPACSVYNYGENAETYQVRMRIGSLYNEVAQVTSHQPGQLVYVEFPNWVALERGQISVRCSTELAGDDIQPNNFTDVVCQVNVYDIAAVTMFSPPDSVGVGEAVVPSVSVLNNGTVADIIRLRFEISDGYWDTTSVILQPGRSDTLQFDSWTPATSGAFQARCSVWGRWEMVWANNVISRPVWVVTTGVVEGPGTGIVTKPLPTMVRGVLFMPPTQGAQAAALLDVSGREVMALLPGANDVRQVSPGVYYIRSRDGVEARKVVIQQ